MLMSAPDERRVVRALLGNLGRRERDSSLFCFYVLKHFIEEDEIQEMSIDLGMLDKLKARVQLARQIETSHHQTKKANHERNWMRETAEAMELELDSDFLRYVIVSHMLIKGMTFFLLATPTTKILPNVNGKQKKPRLLV